MIKSQKKFYIAYLNYTYKENKFIKDYIFTHAKHINRLVSISI